MRTFVSDARFALRLFARTPAFTLAAILSLALGIGANTAIFSVASGMLLRPLPYADPDRLVILWNRSPGLGIVEDWFSTAQYFDVKTTAQSFDEVAIALGSNVNLTGGGGPPERVGTMRVSSNLLPMLGARAEVGRLFQPEEDREGTAPVAVLHHGIWMRRYGGDPGVVGQTMILNGISHEILGVLPASFAIKREVLPTLGVVADGEVFVSMRLPASAPDVRGREDYNILARLRPGVTASEAQAEMDALTARLRQAHPDLYPPNGGLTFSVVPLKEQVVGEARTAVWVLTAAVAFVLLIACANVANLLLSRSLERRREVAVRAALGAGRGRLVRQLLTESVLLSLAGGGLGVLVAWWSLAGIRVLGPASVPRLAEITLDGGALAFTLVVSIGAGILFGIVPALRLGRIERHGALREAARGSSEAGSAWRRGRGGRRLLVVAEVALAVIVLVGAGLLVRSFARLQNVPPGFDPSGVLTMEVTLTGQRYPDGATVLESYKQLWERLSALPEATAAGGISALPLSNMMAWGPITVEGREPPPGERFLNADMRFVAGDYFEAMRIPIVQGRRFATTDIASNPRVAVVDEFMAEQIWPGVDPVGKRFRLGGPDSTSPWVTVVGVAGRIKQDALDTDSRIAIYFPHAQFPTRAINIVVRTGADPARLAGAVTSEIRRLDPELPIYNVRTMADRVSESLARRRFAVVLLALFAGLALALAAIGVYGVIAYLVSQGTREIGIRMALGATPQRILLLVLRHGAVTAAAGLILGLAGAAGAVQFMRRLLFGVEPLDVATFGGVALALALIAMAATAIPARRASRVDPSVSLRAE